MKYKTFAISIMFAVLPIFAVLADQATQGSSAANSAVSEQMGWAGDAESLVQNIGAPMTGGQLMTTPNTQKSFNARITCPNSQKYLEIFIQPAATGDLGTVYVAHDMDYNGTYDYTLAVPYPVSGVCANGIISCTPGTWINCVPMMWKTGTDDRITLVNASWGQLGGCYCINNSCGSGLAYSNTATILRDLGSGVATAIQGKDPRKAITAAKVQNFSITYYGQGTGSCQTAGGYSGMNNPVSLFMGGKSDALLAAQRDVEVQAQSLDPGSYYSLIKASASQNMPTKNSCTITRKVLIEKNYTCPDPGVYNAGGGYCEAGLAIGTTVVQSCGGTFVKSGHWIGDPNEGGTWQWDPPGFTATGEYLYVSGQCFRMPGANMSGSSPAGNSLSGYMCARGNVIGNQVQPFEGCMGGGGYYPPSLPGCCQGGGVTLAGEVQITGNTWLAPGMSPMTASGNSICQEGFCLSFTGLGTCPAGFTRYWTGIQTICKIAAIETDTMIESIDDKCQAFESDSKCKLQAETVDGVQTIQNFVPTFLSPFESCKTFTGKETHSLCRQWWVKNRTYQCENENVQWDYLKKRMKKIYSTTSGDPTQFTYSDVRLNGATWVEEAGSTTGIKTLSFNTFTCEKACKLRRPVADTRAGMVGNAQQLQNSPTRYEYVYQSCSTIKSGGKCTVGAGEELIKDCQCIDDFAEAATILATFGAANKDAICSSGVKE